MTTDPTTESPFRVVATDIAWECPWYRVRRDELILPNGESGVYHTIEKPDAVWVLPVTPTGMIPMLRQYRHTIDTWCWEIPAGSVKPGQSIEHAAAEELLEEVGGTADGFEYLGRFYLANGICNEVGHIYFATGVILGPTSHESTEVMEIHLMSAAEVIRMARNGEISDGPSALAILLSADRLSLTTT